MKAIICNANDRLVWAEVPNPIIKPGDALIEIHAAAINRADLLQRAGQYPPPAGWPEWFGLEVAGVIVALGAEAQAQDEWHIGDQVCALLGGGGYAEYVACPTEMLMPIPKGVSMQEAAALPEAFGAAYLFLFYEARLRAGDTVLMQAGASGLASVVIPMANMVDYSTTKAAVIGFTKALAKELAPKRILVNAVSPGSVSSHQDVEEPSELSFLGRTGTHTENANLICFLAGDESTYIAGQNIQIDGCRKKM